MFGTLISSPYFQSYEVHYTDSEFVLVPMLIFPFRRIAAESTPKMVLKTIPGIFFGYYQNVHGMTKDYIVISLALLHEAECYPNDPLSWRLTPQRVGRVIFNSIMTPQFPPKPGYDARGQSI